jgi:translation initiation factor 1
MRAIKCHSYSDHFSSCSDDGASSIPVLSLILISLDIRVQQRSGRKTLTTIQGLPASMDPKRALKAFKKGFACNGTIVEDPELGEVIQLSGDQRQKVASVLVEEGICTKEEIRLHGF